MVWRSLHPYTTIPDPDESTFTKARQRLGVAPMRELFHDIAPVLAAPGTPGVFYRSWRLMGIDGTTFDMPDTPDNARIFGRGGNQRSPNAFPHVRVMALCELGTHAVIDFALRPINHGEQCMVPRLARSLQPGMLLLWDRNFYGFDLIQSVLDRGAHLLARVKTSQLIFERLEDLPDGSYLSCIYPSFSDRRRKRNGRIVRIIEYTHNDPSPQAAASVIACSPTCSIPTTCPRWRRHWFTINAGKRNSSLTKSKRISTADPSSCVAKPHAASCKNSTACSSLIASCVR